MARPVDNTADDCVAALERCVAALRAGVAPDERDLSAGLVKLSGYAAARDPYRVRKALLREIWGQHFDGVARCTAARLIASRWSRFHQAWTEAYEPIPGTAEYLFDRLARSGVAPLSTSTVINDLDATLDAEAKR